MTDTIPELYVDLSKCMVEHDPTVAVALECITNLLRVTLNALDDEQLRVSLALQVASQAAGFELKEMKLQ